MGTRKLRTQSNRQLGRKKAIDKIKNIKKEKTSDIVKINLKGEQFTPKPKKRERFEDKKDDEDKKLEKDEKLPKKKHTTTTTETKETAFKIFSKRLFLFLVLSSKAASAQY